MRKELTQIGFIFAEIFLVLSLLSYSPLDPSIHNPASGGPIHNLFGMTGACLSGVLIGLFGLGAFWTPILLWLSWVRFSEDRQTVKMTLLGGVLLMVATGGIFSSRNSLPVYITSGGAAGMAMKELLIEYFNMTGGILIMMVLWIIGFKLTTRFSVHSIQPVAERFGNSYYKLKELAESFWMNRQQRQQTVDIRNCKPSERCESQSERTIRESRGHEFEIPNLESEAFQLPVEFLDDRHERPACLDKDYLQAQCRLLESKLEDFGVKGRVTAVNPGPVITTYEYAPASGVKINKITNLADDLAMGLSAMNIRIVAPIPGKSVIGIEIPNAVRETVKLKEVICSESFRKSESGLTMGLGKDIVGNPVVAELDKMPHLLIAGATGSGKSVGLNAMICSFLYKSPPEDVKLIMIDPKRIELSVYDGIPHLIAPVVTEVKQATNALFWAVAEMERRYTLLSEKKVRSISRYNLKIAKEQAAASDLTKQAIPEKVSGKLPYIVIIIDELADLMMASSKEVEVALTRLAQMARASGIHLILATQRPSVDVLTGIIKANFPTRLSFKVSSKVDSRTILDANGAEDLLGSGDMLFLPPGTSTLQRIHGAYISEDEISRITEYLKEQKTPDYDYAVLETSVNVLPQPAKYDDRYDEAVAVVSQVRQASVSVIRRHLRISEKRALKLIEMMEKDGIVGPSDGVRPREILIPAQGELHRLN